MRKAQNGFDFLAKHYDWMSWLYFFDVLTRSQTHFIKKTEEPESVLILGGGTGKFLLRFVRQFPNAKIDCVDISNKMLQISESKLNKKKVSPENIQFIYEDFFEFIPIKSYDLVVCNFFLDVFESAKLAEAIDKIEILSAPKSRLYFTDFSTRTNFFLKKLFYKINLWILMRFFNLTCGLGLKNLPDFERELETRGFSIVKKKKYLLGHIQSIIFERKA